MPEKNRGKITINVRFSLKAKGIRAACVCVRVAFQENVAYFAAHTSKWKVKHLRRRQRGFPKGWLLLPCTPLPNRTIHDPLSLSQPFVWVRFIRFFFFLCTELHTIMKMLLFVKFQQPLLEHTPALTHIHTRKTQPPRHILTHTHTYAHGYIALLPPQW